MAAIKYSFFSILCCFTAFPLFMSCLPLTGAEQKACSQCRKKILPGKQYLVSKGRTFCSRKCYIQTLPECTICGKRSFTGGIYAMDHSFFACTDCMKLPRCFSCQFPTREGTGLSAERVICPTCAKTSVSNPDQARMIFEEVRAEMRSFPGIATRNPIQFALTDPITLHRLSGSSTSIISEQGLYQYNADIRRVVTRDYLGRKTGENLRRNNESFHIYVLDHLPRDRMEHVIAHELAHDWMTTYYPGIREDWIKEGVAEYIAWQYNQHKNRTALNRRIENNPDPVYGNGFRSIRDLVKNRGFNGLKKFLESKSKQNLRK
ncbi:MAG: hypothetical protein J5858_07830 [Lentisphaeria bacterium]|nr:hypothetical protein [Lentisphaeria bacterium]